MKTSIKQIPSSLLIAAIRFYQRALSPALAAASGPGCGCRFTPTCSHYAVEAVRRHGAAKGAWLALRRLSRCHPWRQGGWEPVPNQVSYDPRGCVRLPRLLAPTRVCVRIAPAQAPLRG